MAAYIRSLSTRANLVRRQCQFSFSYILHHDDDRKRNSIDEGPLPLRGMSSSSLQQRGFASGFINNSSKYSGFSQERRRCSEFSLSPSIGASFLRYMSTTIGEGSEKLELMSDVADVLTDTTVQAVANPAVNEVAVAAADSFFPVAILQHVIDNVHSFTGFNWWASIILTTLLIRGATVPLLINQLKATSKLTLMRPRLEEIKQQMQDKGMDPATVAEGQKQMKLLFNEYGVSPFTPLKGLFIQGPVFISFFLAISNMVEKVPSFKTGGAFWFVDLTTPDSLYIFPILTALTFWITVECNMQEGMEGNPAAGTMKNVSRVLAAVSIPLTMSFPKAIFCYWITSNLFSLFYGLVLKVPGVKKTLGIPKIPVPPAGTASQSSFSLSSAIKQALAAKQQVATSSPVESSSKMISDQRISSSSVISQRIKSLEKQVKGRKKNKKR
ncbi:hypothetical protein JCGZ_01527 [Jatropha curcas]|uniref:Membrane insertase YidC/Oxa/ALB C-terminal domain-containing protein n=2 Tax=Jatropha curcas TaxID=180498 RepID=A0A067L9D5_JATCU|nr:mitochondrial inner membrane protein OXA1 isoform X2 [Jatropha curcas]XP_037495039.1 mitochondrial inner membrane protein OXA1 isoform X2 [Jatropha curcas]KDP45027.1 hypothetical protein JCGZ_01527 [Jatropha curcas]